MDRTIEEGSVLSEGNGIGFGVSEEVYTTGTTPGLCNRSSGGITVDEEHLSTVMVADGGIGFGSKIIQKVVHTGGSIGGGEWLFGRNVTKIDKDGVVNGYDIV